MAEFLLGQWEAIELFCEVISKAEGKDVSPIEDFIRDNRKLRERLEKLKDIEGSRDFSHKYFKKRLNTTNKLVADRVELMAFLSQNILTGIPFLIDEIELDYIIRFIDDGNADRKNNYKPYTGRGITNISDKQRAFENTDWWLFYHSNLQYKPEIGFISKAILSLLPFGRAKIIRPLLSNDPNTQLVQNYVGRFYVYGDYRELLKLELKTEDGDRDLHMLMYIGDTIPPVTLGTYNNHYTEQMSIGAIFLERIEGINLKNTIKSGNGKTLVNCTTSDSPEYDDIRLVIRDYFQNEKRYVDIAKGKYTIDGIIEWLGEEARAAKPH